SARAARGQRLQGAAQDRLDVPRRAAAALGGRGAPGLGARTPRPGREGVAQGGGAGELDGHGLRGGARAARARAPPGGWRERGGARAAGDRDVRAARRGPPPEDREGQLMLVPMIDTSPRPAAAGAAIAQDTLTWGLEAQVQNALNVWLPMKNPSQMPA